MKRFKDSLLDKVRVQRCNNNDDDDDLKTSITNYFDMFDSGLVEKSIQCSMCNGIAKEQTPFEELLLYFDQIHHDRNSKNNSCYLGDMLKSYSTDFVSNLECKCQACNEATRMIVQNCICCYPEILCIFLCRNSFKDGTEGKILLLVDFPVENFKPNEHLGINEATDDTTYYLVASVNHHPRPNNQGHYTVI